MIRIEGKDGAGVEFTNGRFVLEEAATYVVSGADMVATEGVPLRRLSAQSFELPLDMVVGRTQLLCLIDGEEHSSEIEIVPSQKKISIELWMQMLVDLEAWLPSVTAGLDDARQGGIGHRGVPAWFLAEALLPLVPALLSATRALCQSLRYKHSTVLADVPIHAARKVRSETVRWLSRHAETARIVLGRSSGNPKPLRIPLRMATEDINHPANRYVAWLLRRISSVLRDVGGRLKTFRGHIDDDQRWFEERSSAMQMASNEIDQLISSCLLATVDPQADLTGAVATIFDDPSYARVHRLGRRFVAPGFELDALDPPARVRPSFSIYEFWCLLALRNALRSISDFSWKERGLGALLELGGSGSGATIIGQSACGVLELSFNATFISYHVHARRPAKSGRWSLSSMRRPDFVVAWRPAAQTSLARWVFLDAKYQVGASTLAGAMQTVHIYRDALRWDTHGGQALGGVLLAPSSEQAEIYFGEAYRASFEIGILLANPTCSLRPVLDWVLAILRVETTGSR